MCLTWPRRQKKVCSPFLTQPKLLPKKCPIFFLPFLPKSCKSFKPGCPPKQSALLFPFFWVAFLLCAAAAALPRPPPQRPISNISLPHFPFPEESRKNLWKKCEMGFFFLDRRDRSAPPIRLLTGFFLEGWPRK